MFISANIAIKAFLRQLAIDTFKAIEAITAILADTFNTAIASALFYRLVKTRDGISAGNKFQMFDDLFCIHSGRGSILVEFRIIGHQFLII